MKNRLMLSLFAPVALAGLVCVSSGTRAIAAQAATLSAVMAPAAVAQTEAASYFYHGHRYPYRYQGRYYNHRRFRGGHWVYS